MPQSVIKWHGGKSYLAKSIIGLMPPRCKNPNKPDPSDPGYLHYVEPYAGGLAVLLANDPEGISEVANDLNFDLFNFWDVIRHQPLFDNFRRIVEGTPFSEKFYEGMSEFLRYPIEKDINAVNRAVAFFVACRQSLAGRMKGFTGVTKTRCRRGMNNEVSAWLTAVEGLPTVHARLKRVVILNRDALDVIRGQDGSRTLFYLDPPYLHSTRATTGEYAHEMDEPAHEQLLAALGGLQGRVLLSGYRSQLYDDMLKSPKWTRHDFDLPNNAAGGDSKRRMTECVWANF